MGATGLRSMLVTTMSLRNKHILLGVTGGIAVYKAAWLARLLCRAGVQTRVVMTPAAMQFVGSATFRGLTGHTVATDTHDPSANGKMLHIELARWADLFCIAPVSANTLAKMAQGVADNLLTTVYLAAESVVAAVPAMNRAIWQHPALQRNCAILREHGVLIWGPDHGAQACGEHGAGRMLEPETIVARIDEQFSTRFLTGKKVIVTAGPTREPWDAVRYLGNHSSGKMGFAMAHAAQALGADVTLISGPVALPTPCRVQRIDVGTAEQMHHAVMAQLATADMLIGCAAVADYRPARPVNQKIKKTAATFDLPVVRTRDILADIGHTEKRPFLVGFAAETEALIANAKTKLHQKNLDMIVANRVGVGSGFGNTTSAATLIWHGGRKAFEMQPKTALAGHLMQLITKHFYCRIQASSDKAHAQSERHHSTENP